MLWLRSGPLTRLARLQDGGLHVEAIKCSFHLIRQEFHLWRELWDLLFTQRGQLPMNSHEWDFQHKSLVLVEITGQLRASRHPSGIDAISLRCFGEARE